MARSALAIAIVLASAAGPACKCNEPPAGGAAAPQAQRSAAPLPPPLAAKPFYRVDAGPLTPCAVRTPCEARVVLTALAGYKVNKEYPFKLVAKPVAGVQVDGTGTFAFDDAKSGTLTIKFTPLEAGAAKLIGAFKLSVCTDEVCEIDQPEIALSIPVS